MSLTREEVIEYLEKLDRETKAIKTEAIRFSWFMRGGLSYDDAMLIGQSERDIINKLISDNLDTTKESGLPFF